MRVRRYRRVSFVVLVVLLSLFCSVTVFGATKYKYKTVKTKANKWNAVKYNKSKWNEKNNKETVTVNMYIIKVNAPGYLTIKWKSKEDESLRIYEQKSNYKDNNSLAYLSKKETIKLAVDKGVYYAAVNWSSLEPKKLGSFRYTFTKVTPTANYSPATAQSLAAGKQVTISMTRNYGHSRWYKIRLPRRKGISFWSTLWKNGNKEENWPGEYIDVYDSNLRTVSMDHAGSGSPRYNSHDYQDAGTYYIRVEHDYDNLDNWLYTFKWS